MSDVKDDKAATPPRDRISGGVAISMLAVATWTLVLLITLSLKSEGAVRVGSAFIAIVGGVGTVLQLLTSAGFIFQQRKFPSINRQMAVQLTVVVLIVNILSTVGWLAWHLYLTNRAIDVTSRVNLDNNIGVLPGERADLDIDINANRSRLVIAFNIRDHNAKIGTCLHSTELWLVPVNAGNTGKKVNIKPGQEFSLNLPDGTQHMHLDLTVENPRGDSNCAVDIAVSSAKLTNG